MHQAQRTLDLAGGLDAGPLFAPRPAKAPARPYSTRLPGAQRRAAERRATPAWADRRAMREIRATAWRLTLETGVTYSVDHIVPLRHPLVCGLHVPANLDVMPLLDNMRKANAWWPDMPGGEQVALL